MCYVREWYFWSGVHWFVGWSEVEVDLELFLGFLLGRVRVYKKPSHSQTWSSRVAKVTATRIAYIHTYIYFCLLLISFVFRLGYNLYKLFEIVQVSNSSELRGGNNCWDYWAIGFFRIPWKFAWNSIEILGILEFHRK